MKCPKCKSLMTGDLNKYCVRCGYMSNGEIIDATKISEAEIDKEIMRIFIGNNADNFFKINNWAAFLFGPFYLLYRKCYLIGYLGLLLEFSVFLLALKHSLFSIILVLIF